MSDITVERLREIAYDASPNFSIGNGDFNEFRQIAKLALQSLAAAPPSPAPPQHTGWSDEAVEAARDEAIAAAWDFVMPTLVAMNKEKGPAGVWSTGFRSGWDAALRASKAASSIAPATGFEVVTIEVLQAAHIARQEDWCPDQKPDLSFRGNEMAGEVGEACNVIKKLERERHGWRGSRDTIDHLGEELADVVHTAILCAITAGIDLGPAVVAKFNATSIKNDLPRHVIGISPSVPKESGEATHRHVKRGTEYALIGFGKMQAQHWSSLDISEQTENWVRTAVDMREVAIYRSATDPTEIWVRPREEFEDGRFEALPIPPEAQS